MMKARLLLFSCLLAGGTISAQAPLRITRLSQPIQFDGRVDEAIWEAMTRLPLTQQKPDYGAAPTQLSDVFLAYDDQYLYLAGRLHSSDPALIRGPIYRRDISDSASDYFGFIVDNFNDKENALAFFTSPTGLRWDATVSNDAEGAAPLNQGWNGFWDLAVSRSDAGWEVELRIPFTTLRFQDQGGQVTMGITCFRYHGANGERDIFPAFPERWGSMSVWKPSQAQEVTLEGVKSRRPLHIAPYLLTGLDESPAPADGGRATVRDRVLEVGADVKYGLTDNLTLDVTLNTDFSQVETDDGQVNLTRFSLFRPEKRQFFLERAGIFDFNFDDVNRLFYSRRIGLQNGQPVRIYGGARLVGRIGQQDVGFLNMQTGPAAGLPSENFTVLRTRRRVINDNSYIGAILTNRTDFQGQRNTAVGLDGQFRVVGDEYFNVRLAQTFQEGAGGPVDASRVALRWERRRFNRLSYQLELSRAGKDYTPAMGFERRRDFSSLDALVAYGWTPGSRSPFLRLQAYWRGFGALKNESGRLETGILEAGAWLETKRTWKASLELAYDREWLTKDFSLTETTWVPEGIYSFVRLTGSVETPRTAMLRTKVNLSAGSFYDGSLISIGVTPTWKVNPHLELSGTYQLNRIIFATRQQKDLTHLGQLRAQYFWNTKWSAIVFLQYNELDKQLVSNARLNFNPKEGNDLYLVINDLTSTQDRNDPLSSAFAGSLTKVLVKYTYTFRL